MFHKTQIDLKKINSPKPERFKGKFEVRQVDNILLMKIINFLIHEATSAVPMAACTMELNERS